MLDHVYLIFLVFIHLENLLFQVIFGYRYVLVCKLLRGNLSYDKTVLLNKVACTLEHYYWHIGVSLSRIFVCHYYLLLCNMCLSFILRYGNVTVLMDTCMFSCHVDVWIAPKYCKSISLCFVLNNYPSLAVSSISATLLIPKIDCTRNS